MRFKLFLETYQKRLGDPEMPRVGVSLAVDQVVAALRKNGVDASRGDVLCWMHPTDCGYIGNYRKVEKKLAELGYDPTLPPRDDHYDEADKIHHDFYVAMAKLGVSETFARAIYTHNDSRDGHIEESRLGDPETNDLKYTRFQVAKAFQVALRKKENLYVSFEACRSYLYGGGHPPGVDRIVDKMDELGYEASSGDVENFRKIFKGLGLNQAQADTVFHDDTHYKPLIP